MAPRKVLGRVVATINGHNSINISAGEGLKMTEDGDDFTISLDPDVIEDLTSGKIPVNPEDTSNMNIWIRTP